jgi:hypothetical protein
MDQSDVGAPLGEALAYYDTELITAVKIFIVQTPGPKVIKLLTGVNYVFL